jgi:hypothetical protein
MMRAQVDRLCTGDLVTLWAEEPATPVHIGLAGLLDPAPLVDEHGQLRLEEPRDHPLWRVTLATWLASGQVGVVVVLHHALADGIAGAPWLNACSTQPRTLSPPASRGSRPHPPGRWRSPSMRSPPGWPPWPPHSGTCRERRPSSAPPVVTPRPRAPSAFPTTSPSRPIVPGRQLAVIGRPLQHKQVGQALGATVNDMLLAAVTEGLRQLGVPARHA